MEQITEWEFTADVASWINSILEKNPRLPFAEAKCEQRGSGSQKRRDLTLLNKSKQICLTGEVKLPFSVDGGSPFNSDVVKDARRKASRAGAAYFFTWNVNECVLWETAPKTEIWPHHDFKSWQVTSVHHPSHMLQPMTRRAIQDWLPIFLSDVGKLLTGAVDLGTKAPDERFTQALEASLRMPILLTLEILDKEYKKARFRNGLDRWMRDDQGWIIYDDENGIRDNLERAAKFACYALVNKLVFHEALLKRYGARLEKLSIPEHLESGDAVRLHLEAFFADARTVTRDYETVFGEDHLSIGNRLPFYNDEAVPHWRQLIHQIHDFDFSKLDYEVIGSLFERLISPEERHKFGQFYTRVEVVDLINSFCIRRGDESVLDPACGGGTFLVRSYTRKRELLPSRSHGDLLGDLYGIDVSHFATHLTTINLATRDLIDAENYPQVARSDFFDVESGKTFLSLPTRLSSKGLGKSQYREIRVPALDAVIGNPPYVRQEDIPSAAKKAGKKQRPTKGTKEFYQWLTAKESHVKLGGRSDIHCYFWPHAATFLKDNGYLCFITSSQWLDVEYGFKLQEWILQNFKILAVLESLDEPWFVGARVATTVTILQREPDYDARVSNVVRFVQLRQPLRELLANDGTTGGIVVAADELRDEVLEIPANCVNSRYRARLISQEELWNNGVELGAIIKGKQEEGLGDYYGGKWGSQLRAPDVYFELVDKHSDSFQLFGVLAEIHCGVKTGKDIFFFPKDVTAECLSSDLDEQEFRHAYGVSRQEIERGDVRLVACGEKRGETRPVESRFLVPEVHNLMEVDGYTVNPERCSRKILLVGEGRQSLKGSFVLRYIEWGESQGYHRGDSCASRVTENREWYDLTGHETGTFFWPEGQQYKHVVPANEHHLICNHKLFDVTPKAGSADVFGGILNSSLVVLIKLQYGRPAGVEGNFQTAISDIKMMPIPSPTSSTKAVRDRVAKAFLKMKKRNALYFLSEHRLREMAYQRRGKLEELASLNNESELELTDRHELDDAVLELIGVASPKERQKLLQSIYDYLKEYHESVRRKEEQAIDNKNKTKRRATATPSDLANQIYVEIAEKHSSFLRKYDPDFLDRGKPFDTFEIPTEGRAIVQSDMFTPHGVKFIKGKSKTAAHLPTSTAEQAELLCIVAESGVRGLVRIPHLSNDICEVRDNYARFLNQREKVIRELVRERTADEDLQEKAEEALALLLLNI